MPKLNQLPGQSQDLQPGLENQPYCRPESIGKNFRGSDKLKGKNALITGGASGVGRSDAINFAKEGSNLFIFHTPKEKRRLCFIGFQRLINNRAGLASEWRLNYKSIRKNRKLGH